MKTKASRDHRLELRNQALEAELAVLRAENSVLRAQLSEAESYAEGLDGANQILFNELEGLRQ